jgi:hypothetical protein
VRWIKFLRPQEKEKGECDVKCGSIRSTSGRHKTYDVKCGGNGICDHGRKQRFSLPSAEGRSLIMMRNKYGVPSANKSIGDPVLSHNLGLLRMKPIRRCCGATGSSCVVERNGTRCSSVLNQVCTLVVLVS